MIDRKCLIPTLLFSFISPEEAPIMYENLKSVPPEYLSVIDNDDPEYLVARARWTEEE